MRARTWLTTIAALTAFAAVAHAQLTPCPIFRFQPGRRRVTSVPRP